MYLWGSYDWCNLKYPHVCCVGVICVCAHWSLWKNVYKGVCVVHTCVWMWQCVSTVSPCVSVRLGFGFLLLCTAWYCCYDLHFNEYLLKNNKHIKGKHLCAKGFVKLNTLQKHTHHRIILVFFFLQIKTHPQMSTIFYMRMAPGDHLTTFSFCNTYYSSAWGEERWWHLPDICSIKMEERK